MFPFDHENFSVYGPFALTASPIGSQLYSALTSPALGHPHAVAFHFVRRNQLAAGLPPARVRPHAGRTIKKTRKVSLPGFRQSLFNLCLAIPFFTLFPVFSPYPESPLWFSKPYRRSEKYSKSRIPPAALPPPGSHSEPVRRYRSSCRFSWLC